MAKIGRNEPCPCGSGKKYKRCCLTRVIPASGFTTEERQTALDMLERFVEKELVQEDDAAYDAFYDQWDDRLDDLDPTWIDLSEAVYDMWFYLDYRISGDALVVDLFLDRNPLLDPGVRSYLELLRKPATGITACDDKRCSLRDKPRC